MNRIQTNLLSHPFVLALDDAPAIDGKILTGPEEPLSLLFFIPFPWKPVPCLPGSLERFQAQILGVRIIAF